MTHLPPKAKSVIVDSSTICQIWIIWLLADEFLRWIFILFLSIPDEIWKKKFIFLKIYKRHKSNGFFVIRVYTFGPKIVIFGQFDYVILICEDGISQRFKFSDKTCQMLLTSNFWARRQIFKIPLVLPRSIMDLDPLKCQYLDLDLRLKKYRHSGTGE